MDLLLSLKNYNNLIEFIEDNKNLKIEWISKIIFLFKISSFKTLKFLSGDSQRLEINNEIPELNTGSFQGVGDFKFLYENKLYIISVKYFENDNKHNLDDYDIHHIRSKYLNNNLDISLNNIKIILICNNKKILDKKINKLHNKDNKKEIFNDLIIYDISYLKIWFNKLKKLLINLEFNKNNILNFLNNELPILKPYLHQHCITNEIQRKFQNTNHVLLNAICRSGKCFIIGNLISKFNYKRILLITPRITSCIGSYKRLLNNYHNFIKYTKGIKSYKNTKDKIELNENDEYNFTILTRQLLSDREKEIDYSYFDLIILDEAHIMCSEKMSKIQFNKMLNKNTKILSMTGTSDKVEKFYNINQNNIIRYNLNHILEYQNGNLYNFGNKKDIDEYLKFNDKEEIIKYYHQLPSLKIYHYHFHELTRFYDKEFGLSFIKLFKITKNNFVHYDSILVLMRLLFSKFYNRINPNNQCILQSIENKSNNLNKNNNITLVYLPFGIGLRIKNVITTLLKLLKYVPELQDEYHFIGYYTEDKNFSDDICIEIENERKKSGKKVICFLGGLCSLGASIENVDNIVMLNDSSDKDNYIQRIYRCMTENNGKFYGNVIDFNRNRIMEGFNEIFKSISNDKEKMELIIKNKMFEVLNGDLSCTEISIDNLGKMYKEYKQLDIFKNHLYEFNENGSKFIKNNEILLNSSTINPSKNNLEFQEKDENILPKSYDKIPKETEKDKQEIKENILILLENARETCKLICNWISVYCLSTETIEESVIKSFQNNDKFSDILIDYLTSITKIKKMNNKNNYFIMIQKFFNFCKNVLVNWEWINSNLPKEIKRDLSNLINMENYQEVLEFYHRLLKPTDKEKKQTGEVFTPFKLCFEMLSHLPIEVWSNKYLKWFDPANGIGNFPVCIYFNLMEGLKLEIPNKEERKKWILEEMIYISEWSEKNCLLYNLIFGEKYVLNIYQGDTLKLDLETFVWQNGKVIKKFDIIVGNPPYQGSGRKKIYILFIKKMLENNLNENGFLLFITPQLSINFLTGSEISQQKIDKFYNLIYINSNNQIKQKYFKNIGSDFVYFIVKNNKYNDNTLIIYENEKQENIKLTFNNLIILDGNTNNILLNKLIIINKNLWNRKAARIDTNLQDIQTDTYKNKIIYKIKKNIEYKYTDKLHKDHNIYKVLYPTLGDNYIIDEKRELFPGTSFVVYIPCIDIEECKNIIILKNSKLFQYLIKSFKNQRSPIDYIWRNLIKYGNFNIEINNENDIYNYFKLTNEEINLIENLY